ncbi:MAG TPA: hypothetical protein PKY20_02190 [Methanothrix sp.]|nr:hypothetical protein [Methanothrix sp.]HQE96981.1 hypothetical protein [Methanothrix sp.]
MPEDLAYHQSYKDRYNRPAQDGKGLPYTPCDPTNDKGWDQANQHIRYTGDAG